MKNTLVLLLIVSCLACKRNKEEDTVHRARTPVMVTTPETGPLMESIQLNATSFFQIKNSVKATTSGYITKVFVSTGDHIDKGYPLFAIRTREADALRQFQNDSLFTFKGIFSIRSPSTGIVSLISRQLNDYVTEGEQLAIVADQSSFVFLLNVPFELNKFITDATTCNILLPDSTSIRGTISGRLSTIDPASQTQTYIVKPESNDLLPENLSAIVRLNVNKKYNAQTIDRSCILTDENMEQFWVMKLINDSTAVKIAVKKGITAGDRVEITEPIFTADDRIISSGNYGLPDTALVIVEQ